MKRIEMIKDKNDFSNIIKKGKFLKNNYFVIYMMKRDDEKINYGLAVSKKLGNAVIRNKLKRQIRFIIDNNRIMFKKGNNYIIMLRKDLNKANYLQMDKALKSLLGK